MKKFTLFAAMAAVAVSANATDYNTDKMNTEDFLGGQKGYVDYLVLDEPVAQLLENDNAFQVQYVGPNGGGRDIWIYESGETLSGAPQLEPGVDDGQTYTSFDGVSPAGWCGGGFAITSAEPADFSHMSDETVFHMAYMSQSSNNLPKGFYVVILSKDDNEAKFSIGDKQESAPVLGDAATDSWQAVSITVGDMKKECGNVFNPNFSKNWEGIAFGFGGSPTDGWAVGANVSFDAVYFFTPGDVNAIESIENNAADIVVSNRTISCAGANSIALYNLNGQLVKSAATSVLGLENVATGVYVAKAGNSVAKVAVK